MCKVNMFVAQKKKIKKVWKEAKAEMNFQPTRVTKKRGKILYSVSDALKGS